MIDLTTLDENQIRTYSYAKTKEVIDAIEKACVSSFDNVKATENFEDYNQYLMFFYERILAKDFQELNQQNKRQERHVMLFRLQTLQFNIRSCLALAKLKRETMDDMDVFCDLLDEYRNDTQLLKTDTEELRTQVDNFNSDISSFGERIRKSEHSVLTHVLTLLGVFSAIIVIIMDVVITANSWLNHANNNEMIMAFIVPVSVIIVAVVVLLSVVYAFQNLDNNSDSVNNNKKSKKFTPIKCFLFVNGGIVLALLGLIGWLSFLQNRAEKAIHIRQIIVASECPTEEDEENGLMYKISYDDEIYIFPCDKTILHEGELHFCTEHRRLE